MKKISKLELINELNKTNGKIFTVIFTKKDGTIREMTARLGVKKHLTGEGLKYNPIERGLLPVFDMAKQGYRMINLTTVKAIRYQKETIVVI